MGHLSIFLRSVQGSRLMWWCPGCQSPHMIGYGGADGPRWAWSGGPDTPTFSPSVLVTWNESVRDPAEGGPLMVEKHCHCFVENGQIRFLDDCTHTLRGKTVPMPPWPKPEG